MNVRLLILAALLIPPVGIFAGNAYAQDSYYVCYAPDGTYFESATPCDYDYDYPGYGFFEFDFDPSHYHGDRDRDFDRDYDSPHGGNTGGGGAVEHGGDGHIGGSSHNGGEHGRH